MTNKHFLSYLVCKMSSFLFTVRRNVKGSFDQGGSEIEMYRVRLLITLSLLFSFLYASCTPKEPPRPGQDPVQEQIMLLQKQILELQKVQNDTRSKLDDVFATLATLSTNIRTLQTTVNKLHDQERAKKKKARRN